MLPLPYTSFMVWCLIKQAVPFTLLIVYVLVGLKNSVFMKNPSDKMEEKTKGGGGT
jgi:hypothetical protein